MSEESRHRSTAEADGPGASAHPLGVHLLAGLPTEAVRWGFARTSDVMPVLRLDGLVDADVGDATRIGILLPPFVEPSLVVESWEECDFLEHRFGRRARIAGVSTFVDVEHLEGHLASASSLSSLGWGRGARDGRTVADILVGQIESATHLALVGASPLPDSLARCLNVLNPGAARVPCHWESSPDLTRLAVALGLKEPGAEGRPDRTQLAAPATRSARVSPPWLEVLHGEADPPSSSELFVYRRVRPFDANRLSEWLANPPREILRGKGTLWLADEPDHAVGYSCAGSVHRLFPAGPWWASYGTWPNCTAQRRRLLERWHPRFGDRGQELVLLGVDLDADRLSAGLDRCLVAEESIDCASYPSQEDGAGAPSTRRARLH